MTVNDALRLIAGFLYCFRYCLLTFSPGMAAVHGLRGPESDAVRLYQVVSDDRDSAQSGDEGWVTLNTGKPETDHGNR